MLLKRKPQKQFNRKPSQLSRGGMGGGFGDGNAGGSPGDGFDPWSGFFQGMPFDSIIKHFMEPASDSIKQAGRTVFAVREPPDLLEVAACYARYERFHQEEHKKRLMFILSGAPAIGGVSRSEMLQAGSRILAETSLQQGMAIRSGMIPQLKKDGKKPRQNMHYPQDEEEE